jgi:hypothetical protein
MFNFNVPPIIQRERLEICKKCKWFNEKWKTCGTPLVGGNVQPEENEVTYYKEKIKLCGCFMEQKVKFRFTSCPARKWNALDWSEIEIKKLDEFIQRIHGKAKIDHEDVALLYYWMGKITKKHEKPSGCASCIRDLISEFRRQLGKIQESKVI